MWTMQEKSPTVLFQLRYLSVRAKSSGFRIENPSAEMLPMKGIDAAKKPIKVRLEAGKRYTWCSCGHSVNQPWCDGSHRRDGITMLRPVMFEVEKTGDYVLCQCKQTDNRPLCDGTHKKISQRPRSADASRMVMFNDSPAYEGVAYKLGYKPKAGGFQ
uniref:CDGSH iron-sulfur domain-containing protein 3, mitochondrial n=1 Tax=Ascaris lumbricoides TaxID=6252 RepID=A0A0M3HX50_ASCLU